MNIEEAFVSIEEAFARERHARHGRCRSCNKETEVDDRVSIQVRAATPYPKQRQLDSASSTFCGECGKGIFDSLVDNLHKKAGKA